MTLAWILLSLFLMPQESVPVFCGSAGDVKIEVPLTEVGISIDLAYDGPTKQLLLYCKMPDGYHIKRWSIEGRKTADWKLPDPLAATSILHVKGQQLRLVMRHKEARKWMLLSFPQSADEEPSVTTLAGDYDKYDRQLDPVRLFAIREIMKSLQWGPELRIGQHHSPQAMIDYFNVNARFVEDQIASTADKTVLGFGWTFPSVKLSLAVRQASGEYKSMDIRSKVFEALTWSPAMRDRAVLRAIAVSPAFATYGLETGTGHPEKLRQVVWIDLHTPDWKVVRSAEGLLARPLERFR